MSIDVEAFLANYNAKLQASASARAMRVAQSDTVEAKANIIVGQILKEGDQVTQVESVEDPIEEEVAEIREAVTRGTLIPSREASGLENPDIKLDESQIAAINMMVTKQYGCLIGAAGSGKTTTTRYFLAKLIYGDVDLGVEPMKVHMLTGKQGLNIALVAFTGIATQVIKSNMPEWIHFACKTIHSLLEYAPTETEITDKKTGAPRMTKLFMPMRNRINKLDHDVIIVDEASMVGVDLWHNLLDACKPGTKIFLIGDLNQLPPVTSHSMFAYALSQWPVAELTHIHRQKEASANKIIDVAHSILKGENFTFDDPKTNVDWRVIGFELDPIAAKAGQQIVNIANQLRHKKVHSSVDPTEALVYDPYRDRIITAGNGYDENNTASMLQQSWINEVLSNLIEPPTKENPRYVIEIDRGGTKRFREHHRVMATKNEPPDVENRVTNGMVGVITKIEKNPAWSGDHSMVGPEHLVAEAKKAKAERILYGKGEDVGLLQELANMDFGNLDLSAEDYGTPESEEAREGGGPASHKVTVEFMNGATRVFANKAQVGALQLAYASTCHKCQGSQFDTAIIVVHHIVKAQLSREWIYTAVTRAVKRVVFLYTPFGVRSAIAKQRIFGSTLAEKIKRYAALQEEQLGMLKVRVRLYI